jgi:hypothetical protein
MTQYDGADAWRERDDVADARRETTTRMRGAT